MGYTATDLAIQLDVEKTIDDLPAYQQENAEMSHKVLTNLDCFKDVQYGTDEPQNARSALSLLSDVPTTEPIVIWTVGATYARTFEVLPSMPSKRPNYCLMITLSMCPKPNSIGCSAQVTAFSQASAREMPCSDSRPMQHAGCPKSSGTLARKATLMRRVITT